MNNDNLKQIQYYLKEIEHSADNEKLVNAIADYIFSHQQLLFDDDLTLKLINALSDWLHGKSKEISDIYTALYFFWLGCIAKVKIDIFYIGDLDLLKQLASRLNAPAINNLYFLSGTEERTDEITAYFLKLNDSIAPFVIFDPCGLKLALKADSQRIISTLSLYDLLNASAIPASGTENQFGLYLSRQYRLLKNEKIKTVIIGNSYGFYCFPEPLLARSVNISTLSLSIKQHQQLTEHILENHPHIENFIFCIGFFELYYDLFKSQDIFNLSIIHAFSQLTAHHNIKYVSDSAIDGALVLSRLAIDMQPHENIAWMEETDTFKDIYNRTQLLLTSTDSLDPMKQNMMAKQRAALHSNSVNHRATFAENQVRAAQLSASIDKAGKNHVWLTPPFPAAYVENLNAEMVRSHRQFFAKASSDQAKCIDLSEDRLYTGTDFRDGDHMNFAGASKLVAWLRTLNIPL